MSDAESRYVADAVRGSWVHRFLPERVWPYAQLARWERPIGWQLLRWPCWWSTALAAGMGSRIADPLARFADILPLLLLFVVGAFVMRGAGCTYNDLVDQDIDDKVARTRSRPLPSGRVSRNQAKAFLVAQLFIGLLILLQFNWLCIGLGVLSLVTVVVYPFMKRITWWPQLFLGFAFSWGALMGWPAVTGLMALAPVVLYLGCILWVIGYDTIYALQDIEDDALVGVKSTARLFGENARPAIAGLYAGAALLFAVAFWLASAGWCAWLGLALAAAHMAWQVARIDRGDPALALRLFKSNEVLGWMLFAGLLLAAFA